MSAGQPTIKCLVWDLDNTLWQGILLEGDELVLRPGVPEAIAQLDARGILHSIASRNDPARAMAQLEAFGLDGYFLHPQIGWGEKPDSLRAIAKAINIGIDALAFVDDQPFERDQVRHLLPQVLVLDAAEVSRIPEMPAFQPRFVTDDSRRRREMMQCEIERRQAESQHAGSTEDFLAGLGMRLRIAPAQAGDLERAEELTVRTHQLNSTGYTYGYEELDRLRQSPDHLLLMADLEDRYGSYGKIGLALVACTPEVWTLKLLLMSCRVISRGVGSVLLHHILERAGAAGVRLRAEYVPTDVNRQMYVMLKFAGFEELPAGAGADAGSPLVTLETAPAPLQAPPSYLEVLTGE
jgi:FkbH-like protein